MFFLEFAFKQFFLLGASSCLTVLVVDLAATAVLSRSHAGPEAGLSPRCWSRYRTAFHKLSRMQATLADARACRYVAEYRVPPVETTMVPT